MTCLVSSWPLAGPQSGNMFSLAMRVLDSFPKEIEGHEEHQLLSIFCRVESVPSCHPRSLPVGQDPVSWLAALSVLGSPASPEPRDSCSIREEQPWSGTPPPAGLLPLLPPPASGCGSRPVSRSDVMASGHSTLSSMPGGPLVTHVRGVPQHVCRGPYFFPGLNVLVAFIIPTGGARLGLSAFELVVRIKKPSRAPQVALVRGRRGIEEGGKGSLTPHGADVVTGRRGTIHLKSFFFRDLFPRLEGQEHAVSVWGDPGS